MDIEPKANLDLLYGTNNWSILGSGKFLYLFYLSIKLQGTRSGVAKGSK